MRANGALAHADIEHQSGTEFDRVTIYRTLQLLWRKELFIPYLLLIIPYGMHCVKTNAHPAIIMMIMYILCVMPAVLLTVSIMW